MQTWAETPALDREMIVLDIYQMADHHYRQFMLAKKCSLGLAQTKLLDAHRTCLAAVQALGHLDDPCIKTAWKDCTPSVKELVVANLFGCYKHWRRDTFSAEGQDLPNRAERTLALENATLAAVIALGYQIPEIYTPRT